MIFGAVGGIRKHAKACATKQSRRITRGLGGTARYVGDVTGSGRGACFKDLQVVGGGVGGGSRGGHAEGDGGAGGGANDVAGVEADAGGGEDEGKGGVGGSCRVGGNVAQHLLERSTVV